MADVNFVSLTDDDASDSEAMSIGLESLKQHIAKLKESRRRSRNRRKQKMEKLKALKEKYERDYQHELYQHEKAKESWQRKFADKDEEIKTLKRERAVLKAQVKQMRIDAKAQMHQWHHMGHLICDICCDHVKCQVTRCGHGFCASCLEKVFNTAARAMLDGDGVSVIGEANCPACRRRLDWDNDVWPIYLSEGVE